MEAGQVMRISLHQLSDKEAEHRIRKYCNQHGRQWGETSTSDIARKFRPRKRAIVLFQSRVLGSSPTTERNGNTMTDKKCSECRFYQPGTPFSGGEPSHDGECRRHAPTQHRQNFPRTFAESWCGEFQASVAYDVQLAPVTRPAETEAPTQQLCRSCGKPVPDNWDFEGCHACGH